MTQGARLIVIVGIVALGVFGWGLAGPIGAGLGAMLGVALLAVPWRRHQLWSWASLYLRKNRPFDLEKPGTAINDGSGGGVRYQDNIAAVAVEILGKPYCPTSFAGSNTALTINTIDVSDLLPLMRQPLGLKLESLSLVSMGSRRSGSGDYPRVYDTLIGTSSYAGQRQTWLLIRMCGLENGDALQARSTVGTAAVAAGQRIAAALRGNGIRARVATATELLELDKRLGCSALKQQHRRWHSLRSEGGWQTAYSYSTGTVSAETLAQAWSLRADTVIQNITLFPDGTATATVSLRTPQHPSASPSVALTTLPGEQAHAAAANLCGPRPEIRGLARTRVSGPVVLPVGSSGVLLGKTAGGERLLIPLGDPGGNSLVHVAAEDAIAKRIVIRAAGAGERITVHTTDLARWESIRMPNVAVVEHPKPVAGTTLSVFDGSVVPSPRPAAMLSVAPSGTAEPSGADVVIAQNGPAAVELKAPGCRYDVAMEFFRAENRYISAAALVADYEMTGS